jgi:hypothetical protein
MIGFHELHWITWKNPWRLPLMEKAPGLSRAVVHNDDNYDQCVADTESWADWLSSHWKPNTRSESQWIPCFLTEPSRPLPCLLDPAISRYTKSYGSSPGCPIPVRRWKHTCAGHVPEEVRGWEEIMRRNRRLGRIRIRHEKKRNSSNKGKVAVLN